ncbi:MAG: TonB-dependent receptor [Terriglobia bacterium]|nr:TonB-dependent receptor [Terriglobia bacterium]
MTLHRCLTSIVVLLAILCLAVGAQAQTERATLSGRVVDPAGAAIPGVRVTVMSLGTSAIIEAKTNSEGLFIVPNLRPGHYRIKVEKEGFKSLLRPDIELHVQDVIALNFSMNIGSRIETVTVNGQAPLVNSESAAVSTVVDRKFIDSLPLNGRSFQSLLLLTPGVVMQTVQSGNLGQFSVNGQRADSNYVTVDGVSANFGMSTSYMMSESLGGAIPATNVLGGYNSLASADALQEFRVQTSTYAPEYGRQPGGQVSIVTRSGTNEFHGTLFDYLRNDIFDARDYFNTPPEAKPALRQNDFGGVFGGPIVKDKAFFFVSYEGLRLRKPSNSTYSVPSLALRASAPTDVQPILNMFPLPAPGAPVNPDGSSNGSASWSDPGTVNAFSGRVDVNLRNNLTLFGRYNYSPSEIDARGGGPNGTSALSEIDSNQMKIQTLTVGLTWLMSTTAANDIRVNYSRDKADGINYLDNFGGAVVPDSSYFFPSGNGYSLKNGQFALCVIAGCDYANRQFFQVGRGNNSLNQEYNIVDTQTLTKGTHNLKFGVDLRRNSMFFWPFSYLSEPLPLDFNSLAAGQVLEYQILQSLPSSVRDFNIGAFAQDTWKATQRLTLTYGVRWDVETPMMRNGGLPQVTATGLNQPDPSQVTFELTKDHPYPTQWANFGPRIGVAYQLLGSQGHEMVLRGGYGIFYNLIAQSSGELIYGWTGYPISASKFGFGTTWPFPSDVAAPPPIAWDPTKGGEIYNPNMKQPYTHEFNLAIDQALGNNNSLSLTYVGALGRNLALQITAYGLGSNPGSYTTISGVNSGHSSYNAFQAQFKHQSKSLEVLASYNWSHSLDNGSQNSFGYGSDNGIYGQNNADINYGPSVFDMRQSASAAITYNIPTLSANRFTEALLGNWSVENVFMARTALPSDIGGSIYGSLFGTQATFFERPDRVPGVPMYLYGSQYPGGKAVNLAAFAVPPADPVLSAGGRYFPARQGNFERYGLRNFGAWQSDLGVHRTFKVTERTNLQFRFEAFNLFNHPNMGFFGGGNSGTQQVALNVIPNGSGGWMFTPGYGQTTSGPSAVVVNKTLAGALQGAYGGVNPLYSIGGNRSMQIALKLTF